MRKLKVVMILSNALNIPQVSEDCIDGMQLKARGYNSALEDSLALP